VASGTTLFVVAVSIADVSVPEGEAGRASWSTATPGAGDATLNPPITFDSSLSVLSSVSRGGNVSTDSPNEMAELIIDSVSSSAVVMDFACNCATRSLCFELPMWFWYAF